MGSPMSDDAMLAALAEWDQLRGLIASGQCRGAFAVVLEADSYSVKVFGQENDRLVGAVTMSLQSFITYAMRTLGKVDPVLMGGKLGRG